MLEGRGCSPKHGLREGLALHHFKIGIACAIVCLLQTFVLQEESTFFNSLELETILARDFLVFQHWIDTRRGTTIVVTLTYTRITDMIRALSRSR